MRSSCARLVLGVELFRHRVEGARGIGNPCRSEPGLANPHIVVAVCDAVGGRHEVSDRTGDTPHDDRDGSGNASTLAALVAQVSACSGGLNDGQCQSLLTRLVAALRDLADGRTDKAIHDLQQFIDDVQRFSRSIPGDGSPPRLDPATAAVWTDEAESVIAALTL